MSSLVFQSDLLDALTTALHALPSSSLEGERGRSARLVATQWHRQLGIAKFLLTAQRAALRAHLRAGAQLYARGFSPRERAEEGALGANDLAPLFDAVAAGDGGLARQIADHGRPGWAFAGPYDHGRRYGTLLVETCFGETPEGELAALLDRARVHERADTARLGVCRALLMGQSGPFNESLEDLMQTVSLRARRTWPDEEPTAVELLTTCQLSVEGLALRELARERGIAVREDYTLVPALAAVGGYDRAAEGRPLRSSSPSPSFPDEAWLAVPFGPLARWETWPS